MNFCQFVAAFLGISLVYFHKNRLGSAIPDFFTLWKVSGGMSDDEYLAAAADLRQQIQDAKKQEPMPLPDLSKPRAALNSGALAIYSELTREERQRFWRSTCKGTRPLK